MIFRKRKDKTLSWLAIGSIGALLAIAIYEHPELLEFAMKEIKDEHDRRKTRPDKKDS
jgi:hypothetical protein